MEINRRTLLKGATLGAGSAMLSPIVAPWTEATEPLSSPRRVIFFLQNHGFAPLHTRPVDMELSELDEDALDRVIDTDLTALALPDYIGPLEPYKDRLTIIQGLNGKHVRPFHGGPYGALGGFLKSKSRASGQTIDCAIGEMLPAVVPHLGIGWANLDTMRSVPVFYASSSWSADKPAPLYCNPNLACMNIFGAVMPGEIGVEYEADTALLEFAVHDAERMNRRLSGVEQEKFEPYLEGYEEMILRRRQLHEISDELRNHVPTIGEQFTNPQFETDWHSASLDVMLAALTAGVTNVATICSGLCRTDGFKWLDMNLSTQNHAIGHSDQLDDDWLKIRRYNAETLVRIMQHLESIPEGDGTMMDNTLIVYTSDSASKQHSVGDRWPFLLLGNLGGTMRSGRFIHYPITPHDQSRTINAFYCTLLHALGDERDRFNLDGPLARLDRPGPLPELLA